MDDLRALMFEELRIRIEHYRFYLKLALEVYVFFYVITGATLGYYLGQPANNHLEIFLLLPILIGAVLGGVFLHGARLQQNAADSIKEIRTALKQRDVFTKPIPDTHLLRLLLLMFGYIFFIVGALLILVPHIKASFVPRIELWIFTGMAIGVLVLGGLSTRIFVLIYKLKPDFDDPARESET